MAWLQMEGHVGGISRLATESLESILRIFPSFNQFIQVEIGDGKRTGFWQDNWIANRSLKDSSRAVTLSPLTRKVR